MSALDAALAAGRAEAEARMTDQVRLYRQTADTFDRTTGTTVPGAQTTLYTGKARVKPVHVSAGEETVAGEREVAGRRYEVHVPWGTPLPDGVRVLPGDRVGVISSTDTRLVDTVLWVTGAEFGSQATAWRISVEDRS
ncbi:DUF6093 family protein [Streptomyces sp. NPDC059828]|uniref:DUF6093 family protein n=1 Tax=Streptomyces sp. NPDC059828 TaxID=3346965 RepID=UPI0036557C99